MSTKSLFTYNDLFKIVTEGNEWKKLNFMQVNQGLFKSSKLTP
jgi:hypothetical protein